MAMEDKDLEYPLTKEQRKELEWLKDNAKKPTKSQKKYLRWSCCEGEADSEGCRGDECEADRGLGW